MLANTVEVFNSLHTDPSLLKCIGIAREIPAPEYAKLRLSGVDVKKLEERWMLESIAKGLIEHNLVRFDAERTDDGNYRINCIMYAVDPSADPQSFTDHII